MDDIEQRAIALKAKLRDFLSGERCDDLGVVLVDLGLEMEAARFRSAPDTADAERLMQHPSVTEDSVSRYALTDEGIGQILGVLSLAGLKYLDHQTSAHVADRVAADEKADLAAFQASAGQTVNSAFAQAESSGVSSYGALSILLLKAVFAGKKHGLSPAAISRILLDIITIVHRPPAPPPVMDDATIAAALAKQLGVSVATARKYMRGAQELFGDE
ncbi:hypothetical protein PX699_15885 [Sphingobium sp. H39-3-25]|uniref:hypothetical protein n=1 Tax=Sphingobium arseniciresistens TaxID=3030834 RepID=UPI0023B9F4C4|nr:hypothetical protein [Sphingobium arseniciresistens]